MKPKGILFKAEMVRAILDGRKAQTRRIASSDPSAISIRWVENMDTWPETKKRYSGWIKECGAPLLIPIKCPYPTGTVLYVKETFCQHQVHKEMVQYRADFDADAAAPHNSGWRPSIFMPKWASRIWLRVTNVRVERLQDISEADAIAEGVDVNGPSGSHHFQRLAVGRYSNLWELIYGSNGPNSWDANPWVFIYEFTRIEKPEGV